jgi:hypothetical protein
MLISATRWRTSEEDWEHHRARIRQLYLDEDRPLKEVMAIMQREHGFKATSDTEFLPLMFHETDCSVVSRCTRGT